MPFTVSHIVATLPFDKGLGKYSALSPLVIGSMTPDIAYLTPYLVHQRMDSHSLVGLYLFCIPMGLTIYFLYHWLMAPVLCSLLPSSIKPRLNPDLFAGRLPAIPSHVLVLSLLVGALTHIIWDFFTHQSGLPQYWMWMDTPLTNIDGYNIMPYRVLQHFSSVFGLALLLYLILRWYRGKDNSNQIHNYWQASYSLKRLAIILLVVMTLLGAVLNGIRHIPETDVLYGLYSAQVFVRFAIVGGAGAFLIACCGLGLIYQIRINARNN